MFRRLFASSFLILAAIVTFASPSRAADVGPLADYLSADVTAVGYLDLTKFDAAAAVEEFANLGVASEGEIAHGREAAADVQKFYDDLTRHGARRAFFLLRMTTISDGGPSWVIEVADDGDANKVLDLLRKWSSAAKENPNLREPAMILPAELSVDGNVVLGAATPAHLAKLMESPATSPREDAAAAIDALLAADAGFVAFGDADSRRVVREIMPQLPAPFMEIDGKLLADGLAWFGILLKLPPGPTASITLQASNDAAAHAFEEAATNGLGLLKGLAMAAAASGQADVASALPALALLKAELEGSRLSITFGDDPQETVALRALLGPAVSASREAAMRTHRINDFRQIAIAMLNYESAKGAYPPPASRDEEGKPPLSWRVRILPYMEQDELYKQFHLDEPWDSEHNRTLIAKMPEVYADPAEPQLAAQGRTTYLLPASEETLGGDPEGRKIRAITDGTSMTILAVEVVPELAVPWTKPADWEVDLADPLNGVKRTEAERRGGVFAAAYCDGSVRIISGNIDRAAFKAALTIAGEDAP